MRTFAARIALPAVGRHDPRLPPPRRAPPGESAPHHAPVNDLGRHPHDGTLGRHQQERAEVAEGLRELEPAPNEVVNAASRCTKRDAVAFARSRNENAAAAARDRYRARIAQRPRHALFVLLPPPGDVDAVLAALPADVRARLPVPRRYPPADDARHLASLVRAGRDPLATHWRRGLVVAIGAGAGLGTLVNGALAAGFGMLGGLLEIALPLGGCVGAFLGGFTAAMTGTERPRDELRTLWPHAQRGAVLLQWSADDREALATLQAHALGLGHVPTTVRDD